MLHPALPEILSALCGLRVWLIGGQAIELLCGTLLRDHDDLDLLVAEGDGPAALNRLAGLGFAPVHGSLAGGNVFVRRGEVLVDLVPIRPEVNPPQTMGELAGLAWPADFLAPHEVRLGDQAVLTLTPAMHCAMKTIVAAHYGGDLRPKDRVDLAALATLAP